ncbi:hypothetical protein N7486_003099 [Penicillium sp. IBT 16267x]|nr:hypothetical protein N7486_003099 [Penicillium sp. IBT 16267x]
MPSPAKQAKLKRASLSNVVSELSIEPTSSSSNNNLAKSLRLHMKSTLRIGRRTVSIRSLHGVQAQFTIAMDDAYDYKIGADDFDPHTIFPEIVTLGDQLSAVLQKKLSTYALAQEHMVRPALSTVDSLLTSMFVATLGARLFLASPFSRTLAWPIHIGNDFPGPIADLLQSWGITLVIKKEMNQPSTRGLLEYKDTTFGPKDFMYTTPVLALDESGAEGTPILVSKVYHYLATPRDIISRISTLLAMRHEVGILSRPLIIWEPSPLACSPDNLQGCLEAARYVDVLSPNHLELAKLFSQAPEAAFSKSRVEELASKLLGSGVGPDGTGVVVVRAGEHGCLVQSRDVPPRWLPPFYGSGFLEERKFPVVDPTGAGNAFLGGYGVGYIQTGDAVQAACYGSVAASFALEQIGMPEKVDQGDTEVWNGVSVRARLREYMSREDVKSNYA